MSNLDSIQKNPTAKTPKIASYSPLPPKQISLLGKTPKQAGQGKRFLKLFSFFIAVLIVILGIVVAAKAINLTDKIFVGKKTSFFNKVLHVLKGGDSNILGDGVKPINILLLGIGGEGHDGPYLTDTMMLAQIRPDLGEIALTSIPRDYLIQLPYNLGQRKINGAFAEGFNRKKDWNEAGTWARQTVEKISGLSIPYFAVVDFKGFAKAIDKIGGVDIYVERPFTDYLFPDDFVKDTKGYLPAVSFEAGNQHLSGERALQFARSRHASGPEGSDFARSQRQQKVIEAFKNKVLGLNLISDSKTLNSLANIFADHFHTNLEPDEILSLYNFVKEKNIHNFLSTSLDEQTGIICPKILEDSGAFVLVPCEGKSKTDVENFFKNTFTLGRLYAEKSIIWMGNSSKDNQLYRTANQTLLNAGLTIWEVNYTKDEFPQTIIYQVNPKPATTEYLLNTLNAKQVNLPPPGIKIDKNKVDIIVILGQNK
jgi:LCP family protein required for cell wall assembly